MHGRSSAIDDGRFASDFDDAPIAAEPVALEPAADADAQPTDFVDGLVTMAGNGDPHAQHGCGIHLYAANRR